MKLLPDEGWPGTDRTDDFQDDPNDDLFDEEEEEDDWSDDWYEYEGDCFYEEECDLWDLPYSGDSTGL